MKKFIITISAPAAIGAVSEHEYGYPGVTATIMSPTGVTETLSLESDETPMLTLIRDRIMQRWGVVNYHGWVPLFYAETEGSSVAASVEVIAAEFENA